MVILLCPQIGFRLLSGRADLEAQLDAARADRLAQDMSQRAVLGKLAGQQDYHDILIVAQGDYLRVIDAHAAALPLCRTMERLRHTRLLQNAQFRTWLARGHEPGATIAGGHIRWSKVAQGLSARLGEFAVRYAGKLPTRGHRIIVETQDGKPATGYVTAQGDALAWEITISNKSHLRPAMASHLRAFGAAIRLAPRPAADGATLFAPHDPARLGEKVNAMRVEFEIRGSFTVPEGTMLVPDTEHIFLLPTGQIVSAYPVIEMASGPDGDDHRDLSWDEASLLGICLDLTHRYSDLTADD